MADEKKFVHDTNRGSAFTNDKASKDTDPAYLGTFDNEGTPYRIVIWENQYGEGKTRLSFLIESEEAFQEKKAAREAEKETKPAGRGRGAAAGRGTTGRGATARGGRSRNY